MSRFCGLHGRAALLDIGLQYEDGRFTPTTDAKRSLIVVRYGNRRPWWNDHGRGIATFATYAHRGVVEPKGAVDEMHCNVPRLSH